MQKLSILTKGSFFGEEELIEEGLRVASVYCCSQKGELVFISKKEFHRRLFSEDIIKEYLIDHNRIKKEWRLAKLNTAKFLDRPEFFASEYFPRSDSSYMGRSQANMRDSHLALERSQLNMRESSFNKHASGLMDRSSTHQKRKSSVLKMDVSRVLLRNSSQTHGGTAFLEKLPLQESLSPFTKKESIFLNSLSQLENSKKKNSLFDRSPEDEGTHPLIGRAISIFGKKSDFGFKSHKTLSFNSSLLADPVKMDSSGETPGLLSVPLNPGLAALRSDTLVARPEAAACETQCLAIPRMRPELSSINVLDNTIPEQPENPDSSSPRLGRKPQAQTQKTVQPAGPRQEQSPSNKEKPRERLRRESLSFTELPSIKEIQKNMFSPKLNSGSHISSKSNIIEEIKDSFKPREMLKLKAFKKFEEIKESFNYLQEFKGKRLETLAKFEVPYKIKMMIRDMKIRNNSVLNRRYNVHIDTSTAFGLTDLKERNHHRNRQAANKTTEAPSRLPVPRKKESKERKRMLPLKYIASEIQASTQQNYLLFPHMQGKAGKKPKNMTIGSGSTFFVEGKSRVATES